MGGAKSALRSQEEALKRLRELLTEAYEISRNKGLKLVGAYLVGSRARGDYLEDSDIDVVLVVDGVQGLNKLQRMSIFLEALKPGIDLFIYTPEEWQSEFTWIKELRKEARPIKELLNYSLRSE